MKKIEFRLEATVDCNDAGETVRKIDGRPVD